MLRLRVLLILLVTSYTVILVFPQTVKAQMAKPADGDNSQWISNSPYPTVVADQQFTLQFTFQNDGTNDWSDANGYGLACDTYYHPNSSSYNGFNAINSCMGMDGTTIGLGGKTIAPGDLVTFEVTFTAPTIDYGNSLGVTYDTWWDMEHNGSIFGNNNVFVAVTVIQSYNLYQGTTIYPGSVQIPTQWTPLYDANGAILAQRTCPNGNPTPSDGNGHASLPTDWDAVELAGLPATTNFSVMGYSNDGQFYMLVAYPDSCEPGQAKDYSNNQDIASGAGAVGYVNTSNLLPAMSVTPAVSNPDWRNCWPPACSDATYPDSNVNTTALLPGGGNQLLTAWVEGTTIDPHWWEVQGPSGVAAVYGRDWTAQPCPFPNGGSCS